MIKQQYSNWLELNLYEIYSIMKSEFSVLSNLFLEFRPFAVSQYDCMQHERSMQSNKKNVHRGISSTNISHNDR